MSGDVRDVLVLENPLQGWMWTRRNVDDETIAASSVYFPTRQKAVEDALAKHPGIRIVSWRP